MPSNARLAALGGIGVALTNRDVNTIISNPALLDSTVHNQLAVNFLPYYADITYTSAVYARRLGKAGLWGAAVQYVNYGEMQLTDESGNELGTFRANDYAISVSHARTIENFTVGASLKLAGSSIETYSAYAILADIGGVFRHPARDLSVAFSVKNVGVALKRYTPDEVVSLPFDVQIGTSFKPAFMPMRFSITAHHLHRFDIAYNDPAKKGVLDANGNEVKNKVSFADKVARHFVLGGEVLLSKNFNLRFGYNHLIRRELRLEDISAAAGFSFGAMIRIRAFEIAYSRMYYHAAGGKSCITLLCDMSRLVNK